MKAPPTSSRPRQLCPSGIQIARLVWLIDLGTQTYKDDKTRKLMLGFETPECLADFGKGPQPFLVKREFAFVMVSKNVTKLRQFIQSWRGRPFESDAESLDFDFSKMLGQPANIVVNHAVSQKSGNHYEEITGISRLKQGEKCPDAINKPVAYSIEDGQNAVFEGLPQWLQERIASSEEFKNPQPVEPQESPSEESQADDSSVPF